MLLSDNNKIHICWANTLFQGSHVLCAIYSAQRAPPHPSPSPILPLPPSPFISLFPLSSLGLRKLRSRIGNWPTSGGTGPEPKAYGLIFFLSSSTAHICRFFSFELLLKEYNLEAKSSSRGMCPWERVLCPHIPMPEVYQILPVFTEVTFQWEIKNQANNFGGSFYFSPGGHWWEAKPGQRVGCADCWVRCFRSRSTAPRKKQFKQKRLKKDKAESQWVSGGRSFQRGEITGIKAPGVGRSLVCFKNNSSQEVKLTWIQWAELAKTISSMGF